MDTTQIIVTGLVTLLGGGAAAAAITALAGRGKTRADAAKSLTDTATSLLNPLRTEISALRAELVDIRMWVGQLEVQLRTEERRVYAAIGYIRRLVSALQRADPDHVIPDPPSELEGML